MSEKNEKCSRRAFIKTTAAVGLGSTLIPFSGFAPAHGSPSTQPPEKRIVPTRPFGKTGVNVSMLALGGVLSMSDQIVFRQALKMGVSYWDTAESYKWGKNERAIGKYFAKYPDDRQKVFLVTKTATSNPKKLTEKLNASLKKLNTSYVDLYFIHHISDVKDTLTHEVKAWAKQAKAQGKIRLFGFSTHKNMENTMLAASRLGWIDGIMMSYNYRLMVKDKMKKAVDACVRAGIGLTAMKTQAALSANLYSTIGAETDEALNMTGKFLEKGYTIEQAKLKAVWDNPHIASICSAMSNMTILKANVDASLNSQQLSKGDKQRLELYARKTGPGYCAGCGQICESVVDMEIPISDIMRYSMYYHGYGDHKRSLAGFHQLPKDVKNDILKADFSEAEKCCPQKIKISKVLRRAHQDLA